MKYFFCLAFLVFTLQKSKAENVQPVKQHFIGVITNAGDTILVDSTILQEKLNAVHHPRVRTENKKLIAAILAFPVPFGFMGLHRIYLGSPPWVPVAYMCTLGGGMLLPLIDFIAIVCASDEEFKEMENNPNLFMWVK